jgi:hypothetical protein
VLSLLDALAEFTDAREVAELRDAVATDPAQDESLEDRGQPRTERRARRVLRTPLATLGGHDATDATDATDETVVNLTDDLPVGSGWFHLLPGDTWRWSTVPEARLRFAVPPLSNADRRRARTVQITVELNPTAWAVCSAPFVDVVCNGKTVGRIEKASETATFDVPITARTRMLDLRFRGTGADLPAADPRSLVFNRIVAPVEHIRLSPLNSTS